MKRVLAAVLLAGYSCVAFAPAPPPKKPKLILAVVVDQFRYEYLSRFRAAYTSGFKRALTDGAVFEDAHHIHFPTVTAIGHSTFLSGATPSLSGIVGNEWFDREIGKSVTSVSDPETKLLGASGEGSSPRRLLVSTVGDEIKMSGQESKVIGVSIKDRAAILPAGHMADGAYWFDDKSGHWVTSSYYKETLPGWVDEINRNTPAGRAANAKWYPVDAPAGSAKPFCTMGRASSDVPKCRSIEATPWGNEMIEDFAEHALAAENLGHHAGTDILAVSFSSNDYVGHAMGPDSPEVRDMAIRTDRLLGKLFDDVDQKVGMNNVLFVMTADHGVAPVPEVNEARHMLGGRNSEPELLRTMTEALTAKYGPGQWIVGTAGPIPYLNTELIESKKLDVGEVERAAAAAAERMPHVFRVYTAQQIMKGEVLNDQVSAAVRNGFYRKRSGDIIVIPEAFYIYEKTGTSHGTPFGYDTHVPVIFMGPGIHAGHYYEKIAVNDIAPTLAAIVGVEEPSGSIGRVLQEMWQ
jgi:arylsulfatase A-like enzyme